MLYSFAATNADNWSEVHAKGKVVAAMIDEFMTFLGSYTSLREPRGIVFHDLDSATIVHSEHTLPAWTNGEVIHIDPLGSDWRDIFLSAVTDAVDLPNDARTEVVSFYLTVDVCDVATILGHELTHHLSCFLPTFDREINDSTWFEEGICFYIPRKRMLSHKRFEEVMRVEALLIDAHRGQFGGHPVWNFGHSNDGSSVTGALFDYWRAISVVRLIVEKYLDGNVARIIELFGHWVEHMSDKQRLFDYLTQVLHLSLDDKRELESP